MVIAMTLPLSPQKRPIHLILLKDEYIWRHTTVMQMYLISLESSYDPSKKADCNLCNLVSDRIENVDFWGQIKYLL